MCIVVRRAGARDLEFVGQDGYLSPKLLREKIERGEVFLAEVEGTAAGYLRLEFLWSTQPYIALIRVLEPYRRSGVGTAMLSYVENALRALGHSSLLSSSQVDEPDPQAWHRHMGFAECGIIAGLNEGGVGEVFFRKDLGAVPG